MVCPRLLCARAREWKRDCERREAVVLVAVAGSEQGASAVRVRTVCGGAAVAGGRYCLGGGETPGGPGSVVDWLRVAEVEWPLGAAGPRDLFLSPSGSVRPRHRPPPPSPLSLPSTSLRPRRGRLPPHNAFRDRRLRPRRPQGRMATHQDYEHARPFARRRLPQPPPCRETWHRWFPPRGPQDGPLQEAPQD